MLSDRLPTEIELLDSQSITENKTTANVNVPISSIIELITEGEDAPDEICPISLTMPLIPVKSKDSRRNQKFELGHLLEVLDHDPHDPITREKLTIETLATKFQLDRAHMSKFDERLKEYAYTRNDVLAYYNISHYLYDYLIHLRFSKNNHLAKVKDFIRDYRIAFITGVSASIGLYFFFRQAFVSEVCLNSSILNNATYNSILQSFRNVTREFNHYRGTVSDLCQGAAPSSTCENLPTYRYINALPSTDHMNNVAIFYETTTARLNELDSAIIASAIICAIFTGLYINSVIRNFTQPERFHSRAYNASLYWVYSIFCKLEYQNVIVVPGLVMMVL